MTGLIACASTHLLPNLVHLHEEGARPGPRHVAREVGSDARVDLPTIERAQARRAAKANGGCASTSKMHMRPSGRTLKLKLQMPV